MTRPTYILAGGGTGGHLYPGLAVAEALTAMQPEALVVFACSDRDIDRTLLDETEHAVVPQPIRPLPAKKYCPLAWWQFLRAWKASRRLSEDLLADLRPKAVLGLGGFAAGAMLKTAARHAVRTAFLNPDAVPGRANLYLAGKAEAIFTQFQATTECFPARDRRKVRAVGCPVRGLLAQGDGDTARREFGMSADRRTLLVFGGSTVAVNLTEAVIALGEDLTELAGQWQILLVAGDRAAEALEAFAGGPLNVRVLRYCDRMDLAYAAADLVLCRGGAVTVAELQAVGLPAVILPYPHHKDRQQYHNAGPLVQAGAAVLVEDACAPTENAARLRQTLLPIIQCEHVLADMQAAADAHEPTGAATAVARWLIEGK